MNLDAFNESFRFNDCPVWKCSSCLNGTLIFDKKRFTIFETKASKKAREEYEDWDPTWINEHFSGILSCSNPKCQDKYIISGTISTDIEYDSDEKLEVGTQNFYPQYIYPIIHIFEIPDETPDEIVEAIKKAFLLYWVDNSACGNAIRTVVESIMDDKKIRKTATKSTGKRTKISLHKRLENFSLKYKDVGTLLMAIKWIGNTASHSDELYKDDLLDGFEFLKVSLEKLYTSNEKEILKKATEINKRKKP